MLARAAIYGRVRYIKQASLILPKGKNMSYEEFYSQAIQAPRDKARSCSTHAVCASSDSKLPECKCWCAECKDIMKEIIAENKRKGITL